MNKTTQATAQQLWTEMCELDSAIMKARWNRQLTKLAELEAQHAHLRAERQRVLNEEYAARCDAADRAAQELRDAAEEAANITAYKACEEALYQAGPRGVCTCGEHRMVDLGEGDVKWKG